MSRKIIIPVILILFGWSYNTFAGCGSATCPLNSHRYLSEGWLQLSIAREYINQDRIFLGSSLSSVGAFRQAGQEHDEVQTINQRDILQLQYGITERAGLNIELPFISREHGHINLEENKWQSWNFNGLGDLILSGQYALTLPSSVFEPYLSVLLGVKLPTGVTNIKNAEGEEAEVTIQPGTGSYDIIVGANYKQAVISVPTISGSLYSELPLIIGATYQANGKGKDDWRFGNTLIVSVGTAYQFVQRASLLLQVNGKFQQKADVGNVNPADVPPGNTGGNWVFVSPGANIQVTDAISAYAYIQIPAYQKVNGIQQTARVNMQFGLSANVGLLD
ncbi:MAG: hypothetical protein AB1521_10580 [Bacteroidota bacterium]